MEGFLKTPKALTIKENIDKFNYIKILNFGSSKISEIEKSQNRKKYLLHKYLIKNMGKRAKV